MFQQGRPGLNVTGHIDAETLGRARVKMYSSRQSRFFTCIYSIRRISHGRDRELNRFRSVTAANHEIMIECEHDHQGKNCRVYLVPAGGCLAVANPPTGSLRVSRPMLNETDARTDALAQCAAESSKGCSIFKAACAPPL